jgi:hypothetical protein
MPILPIISLKAGPLPLSAQFSAPSDGPVTLIVSGSVWSTSANQLIGVTVQIDGKTLGSAMIFSNGAITHRAAVPFYIPVTLSFGTHTITLVPLNSNTTSDLNDYFNVVLDY